MTFKELNKFCAVTSLLYAFVLSACQGQVATDSASDTGTVLSAEKPSTVVGAVQDAILVVGNGLVSAQAIQSQSAHKVAMKVSKQVAVSDLLCDRNATPLDDQGNYMDSQSVDYPSRLFYCKLAKDSSSPESVPGALRQLKSISCAVEKAGVVYDNQEHQISVTLDTSCFTQDQLDSMDTSPHLNLTYRASKPAWFNTYYDSGISFTAAEIGTHQTAAKVSGTTVEFIIIEDQNAISANKSRLFGKL